MPMESFPYWSKSLPEITQSTNSSVDGLSSSEAQAILRRVGPNRILSKEHVTPLRLFLNQFTSPIVIILIFATIVSAFLGDWVDAVIILLIVLGSALLSFYQENNANNAAAETAGTGVVAHRRPAGWKIHVDSHDGSRAR